MCVRSWIGFLALLLLVGVACQPAISPDDPLAYFPNRRALRKGVVNKYYVHYASTDGYERTTDISYYQYRLMTNDRLRITVYGPDCRPREESEYRFRDGRMELLANQFFRQSDTLRSKIVAPAFLNWAGDSAYFRSVTSYDSGREVTNETRQTSVYDTTVVDRRGRVFHRAGLNTYTFDENPAERIDTLNEVAIYATGLGLFSGEYEVPSGRVWMELTEQISYERFAALAGQVPPLVGHIDPRKTLDRSEDFELCASATSGYPYYVGRSETHYRGGKRALRDTLTARLDTKLLMGASGYLTFRFMISCEGETGRFITNQADLDFGPHTFPEATVRHLYDILRTLPGWQPAIPRDQPRDTYTYLTFKFVDGALVDLLP